MRQGEPLRRSLPVPVARRFRLIQVEVAIQARQVLGQRITRPGMRTDQRTALIQVTHPLFVRQCAERLLSGMHRQQKAEERLAGVGHLPDLRHRHQEIVGAASRPRIHEPLNRAPDVLQRGRGFFVSARDREHERESRTGESEKSEPLWVDKPPQKTGRERVRHVNLSNER